MSLKKLKKQNQKEEFSSSSSNSNYSHSLGSSNYNNNNNTDLSAVYKFMEATVKAREEELKAEIVELRKDLKAAITERNALKRRVSGQSADRGVVREIRDILGTFNGFGASTEEAVEIVKIMSQFVQFFVNNEIYFDRAYGVLKAGYKTNAKGCSGPYGLRRAREAVSEACQVSIGVVRQLVGLEDEDEGEECKRDGEEGIIVED